jgi:hypothetical protein
MWHLLSPASLSAQANPPPRRNPPKSVSDLLGGDRDWAGPTEPAAPAQPPAAPPAGDAGGNRAALTAAIDVLSKRIAAGRTFVPPNPRNLKAHDDLQALAAEYRQLRDGMRERLYIADPPPESAGGKAIAEFIGLWGGVARKLWKGTRTDTRISVPEGAPLLQVVRSRSCPIQAEIPGTLPGGVLPGPGWACLNDAFFSALARHEAGTNEILRGARRNALGSLDAALGELGDWLQRTEGLRRLRPEGEELRREFAARLHAVWLAGITARRDELIRIRDTPREPRFQAFLAVAPSVNRPGEGSAPVLPVPVDRTLQATVGNSHAAARVVEAPAVDDDAGFARQLHAVHRDLLAAESTVAIVERRELNDFARQLAIDLAADPTLENPRASPRFAAGMQRQRDALALRRPARVDELRRTLEARRLSVLQLIATR